MNRCLHSGVSHLTILCTTTGFLKATVSHQETIPPKGAKSPSILPAAFNAGLNNPGLVSDQNIHPIRTCGFYMGVSVVSSDLASHSFPPPYRVLNLVLSIIVSL